MKEKAQVSLGSAILEVERRIRDFYWHQKG